MSIVVYTDGGARPNPGPGGWAAIVLDGGQRTELSGGEDETTNNRMELSAAIAALEHLPARSKVDLYTDSTYVRQGITSWLPGWVRNNWQRRQGGAVKNQDLWQRLARATSGHDVSWHWVKGHAGNELNERADELATEEILKRTGGEGPVAAEPAATPETELRATVAVRCVGRNGRWMVRVEDGSREETLTGRSGQTSANRLALEAALELFSTLPPEPELLIVSGSDYLRQGATEWMNGWKQRDWHTSSGDAVKNADLWKRIDRELGRRTIHWSVLDKKSDVAKELKKLLKG